MKTLALTLGIGLLAGIFGGLVGLGGGVVMIPLMLAILRLSQHQAHATSLVAVVFTGLGGALSYGMEGEVDVLAAVFIALPAVLFAYLGARTAHKLPEWKLKRIFGLFVIVVSILLLSRPFLYDQPPIREAGGIFEDATLLLIGMLTGYLSGMMGIGGGSLMVPAMVLLLGFSQHLAQGTSLLAMIPGGASGAWTYWRIGTVHKPALPGLIGGVLVGTLISGYFANQVPEAWLRLLFAAVLILTGVRYLRAGRPRETETKTSG